MRITTKETATSTWLKLNDRTKTLALSVTLFSAILVRMFLSALTSFGPDFHNLAELGRLVLAGVSPGTFGVYVVPAYLSGAALSLWLALTHNPHVQYRLAYLFSIHPPNSGSLLTSDMLAFTFVMRLPMLITDLLTIIAILTIVKSITHNTHRALLGGLLWASSPLVFLFENSYMLEIYPALLILLGAFAIRYRRPVIASTIASLLFALGTLIRLSPLLFVWIYIVAFSRLRKLRCIIAFLGVQVAAALLALYFIVHTSGWDSVVALTGTRPGIIIPEVLTTLGPFITATINYNPYGIGLSFVFYLLMAYLITKPATWHRRSLGAEVLAFFVPYYALTSFSIPYLLWVLPTFLVYALTTRFGSGRFLLSTWLGFAAYLFESSKPLMGDYAPSAVFFIPNMNNAMTYVSASLYQLYLVPLLPQVFRSLFSATLFLALFFCWGLKENKDLTSVTSPANPTDKSNFGLQTF